MAYLGSYTIFKNSLTQITQHELGKYYLLLFDFFSSFNINEVTL